MYAKFIFKSVLLSLLLVGVQGTAFSQLSCKTIDLKIDNQSKESIQLQSSSSNPVKVKAEKNDNIKIELISYQQKFCRVVELSLDDGKTTKRYLRKYKAKNYTITIDKNGKVTTEGLSHYSACPQVNVTIDNKSDKSVELQSYLDHPVKVKASQKKVVELELVSYGQKFCSVIEVSLDNGKTINRYVKKVITNQNKAKSPNGLQVTIDKEGKIETQGLSEPLKQD